MPGSILGTAVRRVEDPELLTGGGSFVGNSVPESALHAAFVRSPMAHARVTCVETRAARHAPGVVAVLTAADFGSDAVPLFATAHESVSRFPVTGDKVRFVGDPVALVLAETRTQAVDAAELVDVDYEPLDAVADMEAALSPGAPRQFEHLEDNVAVRRHGEGDPLAGAAHVVRLRMENNRLATAPVEPNAILVDPDPADGHSLTVHVSSQHPHGARQQLAGYTGLDEADIRVVVPHVGGAFGGKAGINSDHAGVVVAARRLGRPVLWQETRSEAMLSMQGRGQVQYLELGLDDTGRIVGMRARVVGDCGAYAGFGGTFAGGSTRTMAQGPYAIPTIRYDAISVLTNTAPVGAFRGAGRPEAAAMLERALDVAADELGIAPEDIRRRNFLRPEDFPVTSHAGVTYDSGDYDLPLSEAMRLADVDGARAEQARRREAGDAWQLGVGIASYVEITGFGGEETGHAEVHADGSATVRAGTSAHGQGHATSFTMLASERLGIPVERIRYQQSDTALIATGGGTGGARSLQMGGMAVSRAAEEVRARALRVAARLLEAAPEDLDVTGEGFEVRGVPGAGVGWPEVVAEAARVGEDLRAESTYSTKNPTFPFGTHVSVVEVDTETGMVRPLRHVCVDDAGTVVNPLLVQGQQHGGALQGMSQALWEEFVYDADGTPLTSTFADYAIPTAADAVFFQTLSTETPTPHNDLGVKGIGEAATIGATPAVQNAVVDALSHLGVRHVDIPCTPARVHAALRAASRGPQVIWQEPPAAFEAPDEPGATAAGEDVNV